MNVGDVVILKSGGPKMTVFEVGTGGREEIICGWFEGSQLFKSTFTFESVELAKTV